MTQEEKKSNSGLLSLLSQVVTGFVKITVALINSVPFWIVLGAILLVTGLNNGWFTEGFIGRMFNRVGGLLP